MGPTREAAPSLQRPDTAAEKGRPPPHWGLALCTPAHAGGRGGRKGRQSVSPLQVAQCFPEKQHPYGRPCGVPLRQPLRGPLFPRVQIRGPQRGERCARDARGRMGGPCCRGREGRAARDAVRDGACTACVPPLQPRQPHLYSLVIPVHFHFFSEILHETLKPYPFLGAEDL